MHAFDEVCVRHTARCFSALNDLTHLSSIATILENKTMKEDWWPHANDVPPQCASNDVTTPGAYLLTFEPLRTSMK
jgi:ribonuclease D